MSAEHKPHCQTCYFWSDKIARVIGNAPLEAYCLNPLSFHHLKYTTEHSHCFAYKQTLGETVDSQS
jgi:hypothetical protein